MPPALLASGQHWFGPMQTQPQTNQRMRFRRRHVPLFHAFVSQAASMRSLAHATAISITSLALRVAALLAVICLTVELIDALTRWKREQTPLPTAYEAIRANEIEAVAPVFAAHGNLPKCVAGCGEYVAEGEVVRAMRCGCVGHARCIDGVWGLVSGTEKVDIIRCPGCFFKILYDTT